MYLMSQRFINYVSSIKKVQMILGKHFAESLNKMALNWISGKGKPGQEGQTSGSVL